MFLFGHLVEAEKQREDLQPLITKARRDAAVRK